MNSQLLVSVRLAFPRFVYGIVGAWSVIGPFILLEGSGTPGIWLFLLFTLLLSYLLILRIFLLREWEALKELVSETSLAFCFMILGLLLQDMTGMLLSYKQSLAIAYAFLGFLIAELIKSNDPVKAARAVLHRHLNGWNF